MDRPLVDCPPSEDADQGPIIPAAALWMVLLTAFLDQFGNAVVVPMLAPYARSVFHASDGDVGYLFAFPCAAAVAFSGVVAMITKSFGRKPVFLMSLVGMALATFCQGVAGTFGWLLAGRTFGGMWLNTLTTAKVYINEATGWDVTGNERSYWFAQLSLCQNVAKLFAPALGGALSHYGLNVPSLATAAVNLVGVALVYIYVVESPCFLSNSPAKVKQGVPRSSAPSMSGNRATCLFCLASTLTASVFKIVQTVFALFAIDKYGLGTIDIGFCFLLGALGTIVASRFVPQMNRRWGPYKSAIIASFAHAASTALLPLFPVPAAEAPGSDLWWRVSLVCMVLCFVLMNASCNVTVSFQNIISGELDNQPMVQSRCFQSRQTGQILVSILGSKLLQIDPSLPWLMGGVLAVNAALPVYLMMPPAPLPPRLDRQHSGYGDEFQDEVLTDMEVRELGEFMRKVLVQKHLKWAKDRRHVEHLLERSIPEMPTMDRQSYYEALLQYAT